MDAVNHLIRKERLREYPNGTDILGVQHLMTKQLSNPYIRQAIQLDDGHFVVICQSMEQSRLFFVVSELQADKTFRRTRCRNSKLIPSILQLIPSQQPRGFSLTTKTKLATIKPLVWPSIQLNKMSAD